MTKRPPTVFLQKLGLLTIRWSGLELMIEICCAYLFQQGFRDGSSPKPPRPFGTRIKFIRRCLKAPQFTHLWFDYEAALTLAENLSVERNDRVHGAYTSWSKGDASLQSVIKSSEHGYVAIQDVPVTANDLDDLAKRVEEAFFVHFNLVDRMNVVARALNGDDQLNRRMFGGD